AGGRALTFVSGPWGGSGLALPTEEARRARGIPPMAPASALAAMDAGLAAPDADFAVLDATPERPSHPVLDGPGAVEHHLASDPDHAVDGRVVLAGTDQLIAAARMLELAALEAVRYPRAVSVEGASLAVRAVARDREISLLVDGVDALVARRGEPEPLTGDLGAARAACPTPHDVDAMLARFERHGLRIGPSRRLLARAWVGRERWVAELADGGTEGARLDACLWLGGEDLWSRAMPAGFERVTLPAMMDEVRWASVVRRSVQGDLARIDVDLFDAEQRPCGRLTGHALVRATEVRGLDPSAGVEAAAAWVTARAAALLGRDPASLTPDTELTDVGFDSMMGVELRNELTAAGVAVPLHVVVGAATPRQIAQAFASPVAPAEPVAPAPAEAPAEPATDLPATEQLSPLATHATAAFVGGVAGAVLLALLEWLAA
ncbi:MAG: hypothetical protein KC621_21680, partial [Myxococcales bacterium]|nr:hypothetical protein [Myxococcales bacterium]